MIMQSRNDNPQDSCEAASIGITLSDCSTPTDDRQDNARTDSIFQKPNK